MWRLLILCLFSAASIVPTLVASTVNQLVPKPSTRQRIRPSLQTVLEEGCSSSVGAGNIQSLCDSSDIGMPLKVLRGVSDNSVFNKKPSDINSSSNGSISSTHSTPSKTTTITTTAFSSPDRNKQSDYVPFGMAAAMAANSTPTAKSATLPSKLILDTTNTSTMQHSSSNSNSSSNYTRNTPTPTGKSPRSGKKKTHSNSITSLHGAMSLNSSFDSTASVQSLGVGYTRKTALSVELFTPIKPNMSRSVSTPQSGGMSPSPIKNKYSHYNNMNSGSSGGGAFGHIHSSSSSNMLSLQSPCVSPTKQRAASVTEYGEGNSAHSELLIK